MASTPRWGGLRPEPYDPDAIDADNDGIVQEGTPWERPAGTRILDALGREIIKGHTSTIRPAGLRYVDANGKNVDYTPRRPKLEAPGANTPLAQLGMPSIGTQMGTIGTPGIPPTTPKLPAFSTPLETEKLPSIGASLDDMGSPTVLDLVVPKPLIPPKPEWATEPVPEELVPQLRTRTDITVPTAADTELGIILWRQGEPRQMRNELTNILAGPDTLWDGNPENRARMAGIMNAVADAPLVEENLYRGESVTPSQMDEIIAELVPGATFTTDMRGYSRDRGVATNFAKAQATPGHVDQIIYEVEPGARALRLDTAVPLSRHHDQDILEAVADDQGWMETKPITQNLLDSLEFEDEHIALGTYEVLEVRVEVIEPDYFNGLKSPARRLVVKVRQTEALDKPEGGWDAPQDVVPAGPDPAEFAAETAQRLEAAREMPRRWTLSDPTPKYAESLALSEFEKKTLAELAAVDSDSDIAELYRERLTAIREARAIADMPQVSDLADPTDADLQREALSIWLDSVNPEWRQHYDNIRDGAESWLLNYDADSRSRTFYERDLQTRAMMAAMMQHYSDNAWETDDPLFRGENLVGVDTEEVLTNLYPVGKQFELPLRGFSTDEAIADGFAERGTGARVVLTFDEGATALPLYQMYDDLREWDDNDEPIEFLDDETSRYLYREEEHLVAGLVTVKKVEVRDDGTIVVTLTHDAPLSAPDGGFEQPKPAGPSVEAMAQVPTPYVDSALTRISDRGYTRSGGIRQTTLELEATKDSLADAYVANNPTRIAELEDAIQVLEAELVRQKSRPRTDDLVDPGQEDEQLGFGGWIDGETIHFRQHFDAILAGDDSVETQWAAGQPNGEPWPEDINDMAWQAFLGDRRRMAALLNLYGRHSEVTTTELHRGEGLSEPVDVVLTEIYPVGKEFVIPMRGFSTDADVAAGFAAPPWTSPADGGPKTPGTGVRIVMQKGATTLNMADMAEKSDYLDLTRQQTDYLEDEKEHLVAGTVRVVSSRLAEDGKVEVVLEMVEPLTNDQDWR